MAAFTPCPVDTQWSKVTFVNELWLTYQEHRRVRDQADAVPLFFQAGDDVQGAAWIYAMQSWIEANCIHFVDHRIVEGQSRWFPNNSSFVLPMIPDFVELCNIAKISPYGWTRKYPDGLGGVTETHGTIQRGDYIGHWIFDELQKAFDALRWTYVKLDDDGDTALVEKEVYQSSYTDPAVAEPAFNAAWPGVDSWAWYIYAYYFIFRSRDRSTPPSTTIRLLAGVRKARRATVVGDIPQVGLAYDYEIWGWPSGVIWMDSVTNVEGLSDLVPALLQDQVWALLKEGSNAINVTDVNTEDSIIGDSVPSDATMLCTADNDAQGMVIDDPLAVLKWNWSYTL